MFSRLILIISFSLRDISKRWIVLIMTILSLSAIFTVILLTGAFLGGFRHTLEEGVSTTEGDLKIRAPEIYRNLEHADILQETALETPNVAAISLRSYGNAAIEYQGTVLGPYRIMGVDSMREMSVTCIPSSITEGRFVQNVDRGKIVLGRTLADALVGLEYDNVSARVGDNVVLYPSTGEKQSYEIIGIIDAQTFQPNWAMYLPKDELALLDNSGRDSEIVVRLHDPLLAETTKQLLAQQMPNELVVTWRDDAGFIGDLTAAINLMTSNVSILLAVATCVIMLVTISINILQCRRQIGIMKSMGASNVFVVLIYLFESIVYSILSLCIGFLVFLSMYVHSIKNPTLLLIGSFSLEFDSDKAIVFFLLLLLIPLLGSLSAVFSALRMNTADILRLSD